MEATHDTHGRITRLETQMEGVATKTDLVQLKGDLTQAIYDGLKAQTNELSGRFNERFDKQDEDIRELRDKETRTRAIGDTLKVIAPFVISIVAVVIAATT